MKIPTSIRVGRKKYKVSSVRSLSATRRGRWQWNKDGPGQIVLADKCGVTNRRYRADEVAETFWHELLHAILWDQGYIKQCKDERFVARFAAALNKTVASAKFE